MKILNKLRRLALQPASHLISWLATGFTLLTAALFSVLASASTYQTVLAVDHLSKSLTWEQTTQMQFARLVVDLNTANGYDCYTYSANVDHNEFCPGDRTEVTNAIYTVTGFPNANVRVILDNTQKINEGVTFAPIRVESALFNLGGDGEYLYNVGGYVILTDRTLLKSDSLTFTFDLEFSGE